MYARYKKKFLFQDREKYYQSLGLTGYDSSNITLSLKRNSEIKFLAYFHHAHLLDDDYHQNVHVLAH